MSWIADGPNPTDGFSRSHSLNHAKPTEHFVVQIEETGTPRMDAAVVRHDDWNQAPSTMTTQQMANLLIGVLAGPIAEARHRKGRLSAAYLGQRFEINARVETAASKPAFRSAWRCGVFTREALVGRR